MCMPLEDKLRTVSLGHIHGQHRTASNILALMLKAGSHHGVPGVEAAVYEYFYN